MKSDPDLLEILVFRSYRSFDGTIQPLDVGKRNGHPAAIFHPSLISAAPGGAGNGDGHRASKRIRRAFFSGLTRIERRTWAKALEGKSFREIAREEGVSRTAIYERFRGNSKGQGGMIAKNPYAAVWWHFRHQQSL